MKMKIVCPMELEELRKTDGDGGYPAGVAKKFRMQCKIIETVDFSVDLYRFPTLRFHKLHGDLDGFYAIDLTKSWRMEVKILKDGSIEIMRVCRISNHYQ